MSSKDREKSEIFTALLKTVYIREKLAPDISVTHNFLYFESCLPQIYSVKKSEELLLCLGTNNQRLQGSFEDKMAT